ncbi:hypothetical protein ANCDUO_11546 [Ancylostoma duodenale]|uniref:Uncharacterized protein n=1 Tax=Ancylostoma duodenale TaxID=51022 RepID=A0A0C2GB81_9BILA|nr:hypothetical protein ANCDUO_11546 [Ancylostoma duodenale]
MVNEIRGEEEQDDLEDSEDQVQTCEQRFSLTRKGEDPYKWAWEMKSKHHREPERILQTHPFRNIGESSRCVEKIIVCAFVMRRVAIFRTLAQR